MYQESITNLLERSSKETIEEGREWYKVARDYCKNISNSTKTKLNIVVGVLALLSPRNKWERNKLDTYNLIKGYKENTLDNCKVCTYSKNKKKAIELIETNNIDLIRGNKVRAFYLNILFPNRASLVTIDTWISRGLEVDKLTPHIYKQIESDYYKVYKKINYLLPHEIQAINWIYIRGIYNNKVKEIKQADPQYTLGN